MPLHYNPQTSEITYQDKPAGAYTYQDGVGRVTLSFTCPCTPHEVGLLLIGLQQSLSYLKMQHPKHPSVPFKLDTVYHYEPMTPETPTPKYGQLSFSMAYECDPDEWIVPLSWFHRALTQLKTHQVETPIIIATIDTNEADITETHDTAFLYLTEKEIKRNGYIWHFHKNDPDHWPSNLHGHDYDKHLKLDAYTGRIYDVTSRHHWKTLSHKKLKAIQDILRTCPDFVEKLKG